MREVPGQKLKRCPKNCWCEPMEWAENLMGYPQGQTYSCLSALVFPNDEASILKKRKRQPFPDVDTCGVSNYQ